MKEFFLNMRRRFWIECVFATLCSHKCGATALIHKSWGPQMGKNFPVSYGATTVASPGGLWGGTPKILQRTRFKWLKHDWRTCFKSMWNMLETIYVFPFPFPCLGFWDSKLIYSSQSVLQRELAVNWEICLSPTAGVATLLLSRTSQNNAFLD